MALWLAVNSETSGLLIQMLLVFGAAKLLAELAEGIGQPAVVGEITAGILLGPSVLGWVHPNEFLAVFSELGVLFLLFQVGLELKDFRLTKLGPDALLIASLGVIVPFFAGQWILRAHGASNTEAIFVGASMVATSVGITAKVLADLNLLSLRASKLILAAAIIDDVLGLLVLAVVSSVAKGSINYLELGATALLAGGFTFLVAHFGTRAFESVLPRVSRRMNSTNGQFILAIALLFALSILASQAGVAAIIGAFLAGMALAPSVDEHTRSQTSGVAELLVPFFLAGIGLGLDVTVFANPATLRLALIVLAAAVAAKLIGCGLGAFRLGWKEAAAVGSGMVPRGEVGMVVAQIGASLGVIPKDVYAVVVFMAVATTLCAPPLLRLSFRDWIRRSPDREPPLSL